MTIDIATERLREIIVAHHELGRRLDDAAHAREHRDRRIRWALASGDAMTLTEIAEAIGVTVQAVAKIRDAGR